MVEWTHIPGLAPYPETLAAMEARAEAIARGEADEAIWLLEHPPLYTAGTSAKAAERPSWNWLQNEAMFMIGHQKKPTACINR